MGFNVGDEVSFDVFHKLYIGNIIKKLNSQTYMIKVKDSNSLYKCRDAHLTLVDKNNNYKSIWK